MALPAEVAEEAAKAALKEAADKWQQKTRARIEWWKSAISSPDIGDAWAKGIQRKFGITPDSTVKDLYVRYLQSSVAYEKYKERVQSPDAKEKWKRKYIAGLQGRPPGR